MFDPGQLAPAERELWDEMFPNGLPDGGSQLQLWSFGYVCMLELGQVPAVVDEAIDQDFGRELLSYTEARLAAERRKKGGR